MNQQKFKEKNKMDYETKARVGGILGGLWLGFCIGMICEIAFREPKHIASALNESRVQYGQLQLIEGKEVMILTERNTHQDTLYKQADGWYHVRTPRNRIFEQAIRNAEQEIQVMRDRYR
jgi:hypothetical protein